MKALPLIVTLCLIGILLCAWFMFVKHTEDSTELRVQRKEIKHLQEVNKQQELYFKHRYELRGDSIKMKDELLRQANLLTQKANQETAKAQSVLKKILFVNHTDSSRLEALHKLYPSFKP